MRVRVKLREVEAAVGQYNRRYIVGCTCDEPPRQRADGALPLLAVHTAEDRVVGIALVSVVVSVVVSIRVIF